MSEDAPVLTSLDDDGVLLVTLNRPEKKNAFNDPQWDGLRDALVEAREDPRVAVAVLTGAGSDFSTGQDLGAFGQASEPREDGQQSGFFGCVDAVFAFGRQTPIQGPADAHSPSAQRQGLDDVAAAADA